MCICLSKSVDDDDDQSATNTNICIGCNTIFNNLPDFNAMIPEDFIVPQSDVVDSIVWYDSNVIGSDHRNVSDDLSECENRKPFQMKDG